ncbi:MAG TPA: hypothetical protein ENJ30_03075 [Desulfobulbaceae bacterium]|nr:hypothetical protein [Desulfobulbaceae bacterium]
MKFFVFCLPVFLVAILSPLAGHASEPAAPVHKQARPPGKQVLSQKTAIKKTEKKKHPAATTFTPSEKIGADTVIAFPVDI